MSRIDNIPIEQVQWDDVTALIGLAESPTLEFKRDLSSKKGGLHSWHDGGSIDAHARDAIAAEVVAFANAWGGTIVLGAEEQAEAGQSVCAGVRALPRAEALARQLEDALVSVIDPPLPSLHCRAILSPNEPVSGVVVIRVTRSALAPHGFGEPSKAYVRRGTRASPMTMGDMQNAFWEARTRSEKISARRAVAQAFLRERLVQLGEFDADSGRPGVCARYSAYPHEPLFLRDLDPREMWTKFLCPDAQPMFEKEVSTSFGNGMHDWRPEPIAHGLRVRARDGAYLWQISDDGSIELWAKRAPFVAKEHSTPSVHPGWFVPVVGQMIIMAEYLRRRAGKPGIPFELDPD